MTLRLRLAAGTALATLMISAPAQAQDNAALQRQIDRYKQQLLLDWDTLPPCFVSSAETGLGKDEILGYIGQVLDDVREDFK